MGVLADHMGNILDQLETNDSIIRCLNQNGYDEFYDLVSELRLIQEELSNE